MIRPSITRFGIILPLKNPPFRAVQHVIRRIASLPIPNDAKIIVDGSAPRIVEKVRALASENRLPFLHALGNKHVAIDTGIRELIHRANIDAVIVLDDDSLIDARWIAVATKLLARHDIVWGFGICKERDFIAGFVNIDLNIMVALFDREYWLESGVYAFRLDAYQDVNGFGKAGVGALSEDHALTVRFAQKGRKLDVNSALHHRLLNHRDLKDWFRQKIRWMGEILLISRRNIFLSLLSIPLVFISPFLMLKASKITRLSFPAKSYFTAPAAFAAYTIAMLIAYRRIIRGGGISWKGQKYQYNLQ
ncbi:MAG: glycosyltransferase family 2 protein [Candidatus Helarchaeota archaeon]|nr:glycosyltransferase family 2 protein [Candidatus Helarchaeota archaeon]